MIKENRQINKEQKLAPLLDPFLPTSLPGGELGWEGRQERQTSEVRDSDDQSPEK